MTSPINRKTIPKLRRALLKWYDRHGRILPWRVRPEDRAQGRTPDPYSVWLSEIMLQQTTVPHATPYYEKFLTKWPTVHDLAAADSDDVLAAWSGLGYYARARNLITCAGSIAADGGDFPESEKALLALPGIGPYTGAAIRAIAFDKPANVVDGNVERVVSRLHAISAPLPGAKREISDLAAALADLERPGDYAQALMDLGAVICTPTQPDCSACPWSPWCVACANGEQTEYPHREPRKPKPTRYGIAFHVMRNGKIWLRRRPEKGLLGGMMEVPSTPWRNDEWRQDELSEYLPFTGDWIQGDVVRHVFTHFTLLLKVWALDAPPRWRPDEGAWFRIEELGDVALPSLMVKVVAVV